MINSSPHHPPFNEEQITRLITQRATRTSCDEDILDVYQDLLQTIWSHILPTLGQVAMIVIGEQAKTLTQKEHLVMRHLQVTSEGVSLDKLRGHVGEVEPEAIHEAFKDFFANLVKILTTLTGNVLVQKVVAEIEEEMSSVDVGEQYDD